MGAEIHVNQSGSFNLMSYQKQLKKMLLSKQYDAVHNHLSIHSGVAASVTDKLGIPTVVSFHNARFAPLQMGSFWRKTVARRYAKYSLSKAVANAAIVTGCSDDVLKGIQQIVSFSESNVELLHYGVNVPELRSLEDAGDLRDELRISRDSKIVVHVGRFNLQKNHSGLLAIAKEVISAADRVTFLLVGDGDLRQEVEALAHSMGVSSNVRFLGIRTDIERILSISDVFLFPSHWEGLPVAALEAAASGLPIVGSNQPGVRMAVNDEESGFLCNIDRPGDFAEKVLRLLGDDSLRISMGNAGRQRVLRDFSCQASSRKLLSIYKAALLHN
jgi:glycosyltransferase involved in cell wall biosynthesis